MRITREALLKIVKDTVSRRTRADRGILSIYLTGALLGEEFLLGGAGDIDLTIIHTGQAPMEREIVSVSDEIHLDIAHHTQRDYRQPRRLRVHPWMGPVIYSCQILHDPQHFMDFTQASVRGQFYSPDNIYERAHNAGEHARQIWIGLQNGERPTGPEAVGQYLKGLDHAIVAVASLSNGPLGERRCLLDFPQRANAVERPGLAVGLMGLLGAAHTTREQLHGWLEAWSRAYLGLPESEAPARLHPKRHIYYRNGMEVLLSSETPAAILWPLLRTWTLAISAYPQDSAERQEWAAAIEILGLSGKGYGERIEALDAYLDTIEETLDTWARANGVEVL